MQADYLGRLDEECLVQVHGDRTARELFLVAIVQIIIEVDHFFVGVIKLRLVVRVQVVLGELELAHLMLHLVQVGIDLMSILIVRLSDVLDALLEVLLVLHDDLALIFVVFQFPLLFLVLVFLPLMDLLLTLMILVQLLLDLVEV